MKNRQKNQQNERTVYVMWFPLLRVFFGRVFVTESYPSVVPQAGFEPPTPGASILRSTN